MRRCKTQRTTQPCSKSCLQPLKRLNTYGEPLSKLQGRRHTAQHARSTEILTLALRSDRFWFALLPDINFSESAASKPAFKSVFSAMSIHTSIIVVQFNSFVISAYSLSETTAWKPVFELPSPDISARHAPALSIWPVSVSVLGGHRHLWYTRSST